MVPTSKRNPKPTPYYLVLSESDVSHFLFFAAFPMFAEVMLLAVSVTVASAEVCPTIQDGYLLITGTCNIVLQCRDYADAKTNCNNLDFAWPCWCKARPPLARCLHCW